MNTLIHPSYFPSISQFAAMVQSEVVTFEVEDNFQKELKNITDEPLADSRKQPII